MVLTRAEIQARYCQRQKLLVGDYEKEILRLRGQNGTLQALVERLCARVERLETNLKS